MQGKNRKDTRERQEGYNGKTGRIQGENKKDTRGAEEGYKGKT